MLRVHYNTKRFTQEAIDRACYNFILVFNGLIADYKDPMRLDTPIKIECNEHSIDVSAAVLRGEVQKDGGVEYFPMELVVVI